MRGSLLVGGDGRHSVLGQYRGQANTTEDGKGSQLHARSISSDKKERTRSATANASDAEFSPPRVMTTGASAAGDVCALSRRHSVAAARITNDALLLRESAKSMPRCRAAGYQLLYINATVMLSFRTRRSFHCRAGLPANSFSTSTQPRCRCASFAPTAVSPTLPAATWWQVAQPNSSKRCAR